MRLLQPEDGDVTLSIHGANLEIQDGEFKRTIATLLDETKGKVSLIGKYQPEEQSQLMRNVDWVVVPSIWWENSPLVIQEAFLNQRPVICSNVGGMAEKVADGVNGLHFRVGDAMSLADTIRRATASEELWEQMRQGIPPIYTLDEQVKKMSNLYRNLVSYRVSSGESYAAVR